MADIDFDSRQLDVERKRKLAELLMGNQQKLQGQMAGRFYVPPSPIQGVSNLGSAYLSGKNTREADAEEKQLVLDKRKALADVLSKAQSSDDPGSVLMQYPDTMQTGLGMMLDTRKRKQAADEKKTELQIQSDLRKSEREESDKRSADLRKELQERDASLRRELTDKNNAARKGKNGGMPPQALKMQQEELDAIGTASSINADLQGLSSQLDQGKLQLGPVSNLINTARNYAGKSNEESRNLASFKSTLEKLRNDSLRLNKGVQTEGDAQRAWNEIISNINDVPLVKQRLAEVQKINERGANLRKMNIDVIRGNYQLDPLDTENYSNQSSAVGSSQDQTSWEQDGYMYRKLPDGTVQRKKK